MKCCHPLGSRGNEYIHNNRRTVERSNFYAMRRKDELIGGKPKVVK
jgi:hypothetical protein